MRSANKAAIDASARMRAAGEQASQDSAAGAPSPDGDDQYPETHNVVDERGHPLVASSSSASAVDRYYMGDGSKIEAL